MTERCCSVVIIEVKEPVPRSEKILYAAKSMVVLHCSALLVVAQISYTVVKPIILQWNVYTLDFNFAPVLKLCFFLCRRSTLEGVRFGDRRRVRGEDHRARRRFLCGARPALLPAQRHAYAHPLCHLPRWRRQRPLRAPETRWDQLKSKIFSVFDKTSAILEPYVAHASRLTACARTSTPSCIAVATSTRTRDTIRPACYLKSSAYKTLAIFRAHVEHASRLTGHNTSIHSVTYRDGNIKVSYTHRRHGEVWKYHCHLRNSRSS